MQIFKKLRRQWPNNGSSASNDDIRIVQGVGQKAFGDRVETSNGCCPTCVVCIAFSAYFYVFFSEKMQFFPLVLRHCFLALLWHTIRIPLVCMSFVEGSPSPGNLLSPSQGNRLSPDPVLLFPDP